MGAKHWVLLSILGFFIIISFGVLQQIISFNNQMVALSEMKKAEIETTKVEYGQCVVKILESNQIAKAYQDDIMALADKAGHTLAGLNNQIVAIVGTQIIPQLSPELRRAVQQEIISCRNAYTGRIDYGLKPMYINFNRLQQQFPNNLYNSLFYHWHIDELNMPKADVAQEVFETGKINPLDLK